MSEVATYLKVGTTAILLAMIEDNELGDDWLLGNPVPAIRQVSHDPTLAAHDHPSRRPPRHGARAAVGTARAGPQVRAHARSATGGGGSRGRRARQAGSRCSPGSRAIPTRRRPLGRLGRQATSRRGLRRPPRSGAGVAPSSRRSTSSTTTCDPTGAWPSRSGSRRSSTQADAQAAMTDAADDDAGVLPRSLPRRSSPNEVVAANWDSLVFDVGRRSAAPGADDGTIARDCRSRR